MNSEWSNEDELDRELRREAASLRIEASDASWERLNAALDARKAALYEGENKRKRKRRFILVSLMFGLLAGSMLTSLLLREGLYGPEISETQRHPASVNSNSSKSVEPMKKHAELAQKSGNMPAAVAKSLPGELGEATVHHQAPHTLESNQSLISSAKASRLNVKELNGAAQRNKRDGFKAIPQDLLPAAKPESAPGLNISVPVPVFTQTLAADSQSQAIHPGDTTPEPTLLAAVVAEVDSNMLPPDSAGPPKKGGKKVPGKWTFSAYTGMSLLQAYREVNDWILEWPIGRNTSNAVGSKDEVKYSNAYSVTAGAGFSYRFSGRWQVHAALGFCQFKGRETHRFYTEHPDSFISAIIPDPSRPVTPRMDTIYTGFLAQKNFNSSSIQYSLYRLSIPVMLSYQWPLRQNLELRVEAGCGIYYLAGGSTQTYDYTNNRFSSSRQHLRRLNTELRAASALVYHLPGSWQLQGSVNFSQMMQSLYKNEYAGTYIPRQLGFSLGMAYSF